MTAIAFATLFVMAAVAESQTATSPSAKRLGLPSVQTAALATMHGGSAPASARVTGRVTDATSGEPLVGSQIAVVGLPLGNVSDEVGTYFINHVPAGKQTFTVEYLGYESQSKAYKVRTGTSNALDFALNPAPISMAEVVIEEVPTDLDDYVGALPQPTFRIVTLQPIELAKPDTSLMEQWHRSMRDLSLLHSIEYRMLGGHVHYRLPADRPASQDKGDPSGR